MLAELLKLLNTGGLHGMDEVARCLGITESLVAEMSDGLARRGYLAPLEVCGVTCDGCGVAGMCGLHAQRGRRILMLTEKGRRAARARQA